MGILTFISWCHHTFNGWLGCIEAGPECDNCYARTNTPVRVHRSRGLELWGRTAARHRTGKDTWHAPLKWNSAARAAGERRRVFAFSLADVMERHSVPEVAAQLDAWRADLWALIAQTEWLDWLLLTKRPAGFCNLVPASWHAGAWPRNVWAGTTCGTQAGLARVRTLLECAGPAPVRFVSAEPLLEPVDFAPYMWPVHDRWPSSYRSPEEARAAGATVTRHRQGLVSAHARFINWIIFGGESGPQARPCDVAWIRDGLQQCRDAEVAAFVKQLGSVWAGSQWASSDKKTWDRVGADPSEWSEDLRVQEFPEVPR